jgi:hypothetical protein
MNWLAVNFIPLMRLRGTRHDETLSGTVIPAH